MTAYADLNAANAYHAARLGAQAWAQLADAEKNARLLGASDYIDAAYRFCGRKTNPNQSRQFPRNGNTQIPPAVIQAACELALQLPSGGAAAAGETVYARKRVKVGEIETEYAVADDAAASRFPLVDGLLRDWLLPATRCGMIVAGRRDV